MPRSLHQAEALYVPSGERISVTNQRSRCDDGRLTTGRQDHQAGYARVFRQPGFSVPCWRMPHSPWRLQHMLLGPAGVLRAACMPLPHLPVDVRAVRPVAGLEELRPSEAGPGLRSLHLNWIAVHTRRGARWPPSGPRCDQSTGEVCPQEKRRPIIPFTIQ